MFAFIVATTPLSYLLIPDGADCPIAAEITVGVRPLLQSPRALVETGFLKRFIEELRAYPLPDLMQVGVNIEDVFRISCSATPRPAEVTRRERHEASASLKRIARELRRHGDQIAALGIEFPPPDECEGLAEMLQREPARPVEWRENRFIREMASLCKKSAGKFMDDECHAVYEVVFGEGITPDSYKRRRQRITAAVRRDAKRAVATISGDFFTKAASSRDGARDDE